MNPNYTLCIRVTVALHKAHRDIKVQFRRMVDFVPYEGMKIKFTNEAEEELDITLVNLHYDYTNKQFLEEQVDESLFEELRDPENPACNITKERRDEYLQAYISQGFEVYGY
jgi:competence transcription factor ComK